MRHEDGGGVEDFVESDAEGSGRVFRLRPPEAAGDWFRENKLTIPTELKEQLHETETPTPADSQESPPCEGARSGAVKKTVTVAEVAELAEASEKTVRRLIKEQGIQPSSAHSGSRAAQYLLSDVQGIIEKLNPKKPAPPPHLTVRPAKAIQLSHLMCLDVAWIRLDLSAHCLDSC